MGRGPPHGLQQRLNSIRKTNAKPDGRLSHSNGAATYVPLRSRKLPDLADTLRALEGLPMQDLLWIGAVIGLVAATLAYARVCDNA